MTCVFSENPVMIEETESIYLNRQTNAMWLDTDAQSPRSTIYESTSKLSDEGSLQ